MLKTDSFWWNEAIWINETNRFYQNHLQHGMESCIERSWETSVCFSSVRRGERAHGACLHLRLQKVKMAEANLCWWLATWFPAGPCEEHEGSENARLDTIQGTGRLNRVAESLPCKKRKNRENERKREERQRERERETPSNTSAVMVCWNHILKPGVKNDPTRQREWLCR